MKKARVETKPTRGLIALAKVLSSLSDEVSVLETRLKTAKAKAKSAEKSLVDEMISHGMEQFKSEALGGFRTEVRVHPNVVDKEALEKFIRKNRLTWLYTMSINGNKLKAYVREVMENGKKVPAGVDPYTETVIRRF